jgi:DNA-binding Lrp family transcriptional regulator
MLQHEQSHGLDALDLAILRTLQANARVSNLELARAIQLSPPATHARVRRLEQQGYIRGYVALLDREKVGFELLCFVQINLQRHRRETVAQFRQAVQAMPEVLECHHLTGGFDYLLKVALRNRQHLEHFLLNVLTQAPGVDRLQTSLALSDVKQAAALPLGEEA